MKLAHGFILLAGIFFHLQSWGFKISPCLRVLTYNEGRLGQERIYWFNGCGYLPQKYTSAVHEHMAAQAIFRYRGALNLERYGNNWKYQYMIERPWRVGEGQYHMTHAIMFGTWWNDDPLMRMWGQRWDFSSGAIALWKSEVDGKDVYPGSGNFNIPAKVHLGRLSHRGRLQHLHFMTELNGKASTPTARVEETTRKALRWLEFAYAVATGAKKPTDHLSPSLEGWLDLPSIMENHDVKRQENVKIRTLFTRLGLDNDYRDRITPDVALGSMLHLLQDSFSPSHTCRVEAEVDGSQYAVLVDVYNYAEQNEDHHSALDFEPVWLTEIAATGRHIYKNDPVAVGAWLIGAVDNGLDWLQVEAHLRKTIFRRGDEVPSVHGSACIGKN